MKKIIALLLCLGIFAATATGCLGAGTAPETATGDEASSLNAADYKDNFDGLCNYLSAHGYINPVDKNLYVVMEASLIGAAQGKKFNARHVANAVIEIYEYDLSKLDDTAKSVRASVEKNGSFSILDMDEVKNVCLSDSGKYLMIYTDPSINDDNPDKNSDNYKKRAEVIELFKAFKK